MTDQIRIEDLLLRTIIGINDEERRNRQDVTVNLTLFVDISAAARHDDIAFASVNYRTLTKSIIAFVEESAFQLLEALTEAIAALCLKEPGINKVRVAVDKPGALRFSRSVGVTIERTRTDE